MILHAIDAATRTGFAYGRAGEKPRLDAVRLKDPNDEYLVACANIGFFLVERWILGKPDLVIMEAPLPAGAHAGALAAQLLTGLAAVVHFVCKAHQVRFVKVASSTVRKHFIGQARFSGENGRKQVKDATIARAIQLGYLPPGCRDDDKADAAALFDYASVVYAKVQPSELKMFGGQ